MDEAPMGFGATEAAPGLYRLRMPASPSAELFEIMEDGTERQVSVVLCWSLLVETVERDWNERLLAKGRPGGVMPAAGGDVLLHRQFGRELDLLFWVAASHQEGPEMVRLWNEATPGWRLDLWRKLCGYRADISTFPQSAETLQEWLRQRAPDGSEDQERHGRISARRKETRNRIVTERRGKPGWKVPKVHWRRK